MCSPLAALSPAAALMKSKPGLATAMISPAAAAMGVGKKKKPAADSASSM